MYIYAVLLWPVCLISSSCMLISLVFYDNGLSRFWYGILNSVIEVWFVCLFCLLQRLILLNMMILIFLTMLCYFFMCYRFDAFLTFLRWKMSLTISSWKGMGNKLDFKFFYCGLSSSLMILLILWLIWGGRGVYVAISSDVLLRSCQEDAWFIAGCVKIMVVM